VSDHITFENGLACSIASSPLAWILKQTAEHASSSLSLWLNDVAKRPNGLMSFDVRGLPPDTRADLYAALQQAFSACLADPQKKQHLDESRVLIGWRHLMETLKRSARRFPPVDAADAQAFDWDGKAINVSQLWYCPSCGEALAPIPSSSCAKCGWQHPDAATAYGSSP
jgi:hypothetical protein